MPETIQATQAMKGDQQMSPEERQKRKDHTLAHGRSSMTRGIAKGCPDVEVEQAASGAEGQA